MMETTFDRDSSSVTFKFDRLEVARQERHARNESGDTLHDILVTAIRSALHEWSEEELAEELQIYLDEA